MKKVLFEKHLNDSHFIMDWNNWIPKKVNILAWKAEMDRLPTRCALARRNVNVESALCKWCGEYDETSDHIFSSCYISTIILHSRFGMLSQEFKDGSGQKKDRSRYHNDGLLGMWKARNELIFSNKETNITKIIEDIK
ncbi:putative reverse transcriptase zinc-binding domain-containing protein [Helianthus annuus]|nr:putative reverse transcriptase zinc-binding domain-containing protein [Helianthus annuus]